MSSSFTPGPWLIGSLLYAPDCYPIFSGKLDSLWLAQAHAPAGVERAEVVANQTLIGAAPSLFDACKALGEAALVVRDFPLDDQRWKDLANHGLALAASAIDLATGDGYPHSPGPWIVGSFPKAPNYYPIFNRTGKWNLAHAFWHEGFDRAVVIANQNLIAAAPSLLSALKALSTSVRTYIELPVDERRVASLDDAFIDTALYFVRDVEICSV